MKPLVLTESVFGHASPIAVGDSAWKKRLSIFFSLPSMELKAET